MNTESLLSWRHRRANAVGHPPSTPPPDGVRWKPKNGHFWTPPYPPSPLLSILRFFVRPPPQIDGAIPTFSRKNGSVFGKIPPFLGFLPKMAFFGVFGQNPKNGLKWPFLTPHPWGTSLRPTLGPSMVGGAHDRLRRS